jgi:hypothetical protein
MKMDPREIVAVLKDTRERVKNNTKSSEKTDTCCRDYKEEEEVSDDGVGNVSGEVGTRETLVNERNDGKEDASNRSDEVCKVDAVYRSSSSRDRRN